jgi:hypothetical protein
MLKHNNIPKRNALLCEAWDNNKNNWTMEDLADIFQIDLKSVYRILAADKKLKKITPAGVKNYATKKSK